MRRQEPLSYFQFKEFHMLRPAEFIYPHLTVNIAPYQILSDPNEPPERGDSNGGVFHRGQLVWTQERPTPVPSLHTAVGYVDGLGHVLIDPRVLKRAEVTVPELAAHR